MGKYKFNNIWLLTSAFIAWLKPVENNYHNAIKCNKRLTLWTLIKKAFKKVRNQKNVKYT